MPEIHTNFPLQAFNTFGIKAQAAAYSILSKKEQLPEMAASPEFEKGIFILGGGSNILLTKNLQQWVWHNQIKGIQIQKEDNDYVWLEAGAGETWHNFVQYTVAKGYGGIENLSLIPGKTGAAPVQNIGAYGVEAKQTITQVHGWHLKEQCFHTFKNEDCNFGYRDSIFKHQLRGQFIITSVEFRLRKEPEFNIDYGAIRQELEKMGVNELSVQAISKAVINIRQAKLPDPAITGNAGSFFKNPEVVIEQFELMKKRFPTLPSYPGNDGKIKLPAGWLIEQCGWKGYKEGNIGVHPLQALVLVNYGNANGNEMLGLSQKIIDSVAQKFDILLEREVSVF